ncbi:ATP-binding cassette domain-containing protein, partial [Pseudomonas chlororaphis]|uniref:ATP-binding cassette domain-containing protein n=1 Tax=Pseudomonas chlororaphis TaxID=587753 RepID=UPI003D0CFA5D
MSIEVRNVSKNFNAFKALNSINLDIQSGELVALLGPSGCGKTTLLRIIAGLETPDAGSIVFHGEDVSGHDVRDRNVGFVFQHYALFRHMSVFDNVAFGLRMKPKSQRPSESKIAEKVHELLNMVQPRQPAPQLLAHLGVQGAEGFVQQQHLGLHRQGTGQGDPLALAGAAARRHQPDLGIRHPRPGRSHGSGGPYRGDEQGRDRADRLAGRGVREPGQRLRLPLPRRLQSPAPGGGQT